MPTLPVRTAALLVCTLLLGACARDGQLVGAAAEGPDQAVTAVIVSPTSARLKPGATLDVSAVAQRSDGTPVAQGTIAWSSSNTAVATVSAQGQVAAVAPGSARILALSGTRVGTVDVTVTTVPVARLVLSPERTTMLEGTSGQLSATALDSAGTVLAGAVVTWSSAASSVADVSQDGTVTASAPGVAPIIAASEARVDTALVTVAPAPIATLAVAPTASTLRSGQTTQLVATPRDGQGNELRGRMVAWSSDDASLATVSADGVVTAAAAGSTIIRAAAEGITAAVVVTVQALAPGDVAVSPANAHLAAGQAVQLSALVTAADGQPVSSPDVAWSSSDAGVARVSSSGYVSALAAGTATITATVDGRSGTATVAVGERPVSSIAISPASASMVEGGQVQFTATPRDITGGAVSGSTAKWSSSNTAVATVSATGLVAARAAGSASIVATAEGQSASAAVTVTQVPAAAVTVSPATLTLERTRSATLVATVRDGSGRTLAGRGVSWTSSDAAVASVSSGGVVTALRAGAATITAASGGARGTSRVTVREPASSGGSNSGTTPPPPSGSADSTSTGGSWTGGTGALYASYRATSPHWPQIRTMVTDFRVSYQPAGERGAEYDWIASKMDAVLSGNAREYRRRNPTLRHYVYGLNVTTFRPDNERASLGSGYAADLEAWARARNIPVERLWLHDAALGTDSAARMVSRQGSYRWWPNPGEPAVVQYNTERVQRIVEAEGSTGIFWDEHDSGTIGKYLAGRTIAEFPNRADYDAALVNLLAAERAALAAKGYGLLINTATYGGPFNDAMMQAAGGVHKERVNTVFNNNLAAAWNGIDRLLGDGVTVEMVTALPISDGKTLAPRGYTPGNSATMWERAKLFELASYYMVVNPARMDQLTVDFLSGNWSQPFSKGWIRAIEADIGQATGPRTELATGTDRAGKRYTVYGREFERALVLNRPMGGWSATVYDDRTAARVALPAGETWVPLRADGTLGSPVTSLVLRNAEAAILVKGSALGR